MGNLEIEVILEPEYSRGSHPDNKLKLRDVDRNITVLNLKELIKSKLGNDKSLREIAVEIDADKAEGFYTLNDSRKFEDEKKKLIDEMVRGGILANDQDDMEKSFILAFDKDHRLYQQSFLHSIEDGSRFRENIAKSKTKSEKVDTDSSNSKTKKVDTDLSNSKTKKVDTDSSNSKIKSVAKYLVPTALLTTAGVGGHELGLYGGMKKRSTKRKRRLRGTRYRKRRTKRRTKRRSKRTNNRKNRSRKSRRY
jgi:hypothetical protein